MPSRVRSSEYGEGEPGAAAALPAGREGADCGRLAAAGAEGHPFAGALLPKARGRNGEIYTAPCNTAGGDACVCVCV